jgi:hypothetical protein
MIKKIVFLFLTLAFAESGFAQYDYNKDCQNAYRLIIELKFDSAKGQIDKLSAQEPENLIPLLLNNYIDFLSVALTEDKTKFNEIRARKKERLDRWENSEENSPYFRMGIAQMNMQWAFARVTVGEYFTAALEINQAYHLLEENKLKYPDFLPNAMGLGVLHAMIGVVPDQYQWAISLLGLSGSIDQGLLELEALLNSDKDEFQKFKPEALFLYTFLKMNLQSNKKRLKQLDAYFREPYMEYVAQKSPLLHFARASILMKESNDQAISYLEKRPLEKTAFKFYYPELLLAQAKLYKMDEQAQALFAHYVREYPGKNFKALATQKEAWSRLLNGDTLAYKRLMNTILELPSTRIDGDKAALKEAKEVASGYLPNIYLLESRILFDGNYLAEALKTLTDPKMTPFDAQDSIELNYRKARIYHHMDSIPQALQFYQISLNQGAKLDSYFAGNSCLMMGEIYEQIGNVQKAKYYYEKCLTLDFDEYRKSIRAKAKAGLQGLM